MVYMAKDIKKDRVVKSKDTALSTKKDRVVKVENKPAIHKWAGLEPSPESIKIHEKAFKDIEECIKKISK